MKNKKTFILYPYVRILWILCWINTLRFRYKSFWIGICAKYQSAKPFFAISKTFKLSFKQKENKIGRWKYYDRVKIIKKKIKKKEIVVILSSLIHKDCLYFDARFIEYLQQATIFYIERGKIWQKLYTYHPAWTTISISFRVNANRAHQFIYSTRFIIRKYFCRDRSIILCYLITLVQIRRRDTQVTWLFYPNSVWLSQT